MRGLKEGSTWNVLPQTSGSYEEQSVIGAGIDNAARIKQSEETACHHLMLLE